MWCASPSHTCLRCATNNAIHVVSGRSHSSGFDAIRQNAFIDLAIEEATELYAGSTVRFAFVRLFRSIICDHQSNGCDLRGGSKFLVGDLVTPKKNHQMNSRRKLLEECL